MNDFIQSIFINQPPAPAASASDPLLAVRRSFGEGEIPVAFPAPRTNRRRKLSVRLKRAMIHS